MTVPSVFCLVFGLFLYCVTNGVDGSKIVLESTPNDVIDGLTRTLTLRCSLHDTAASATVVGRRDITMTSDNVAEVSAVIVMRDGKDIASVSRSVAAKVMDGSSNINVTGSVSGSSGERAFLEMSFMYPSSNESGEYQCDIDTVRGGHSIVFTSKGEVTVSTPSLADVVKYVRVNDQELREKDMQMSGELEQIKKQINTTVLFSAGLTTVLTIPAGQTVTYDRIYANIGGSYNEKTGEFICTTPGHYYFSFSAYIDPVRPHAFLRLFHNSEATFSMVGFQQQGDYDMLFNGGILTLARGDVVKVVSKDQSVIYNSPVEVYATFSGHLLALV